MLRIEHIYKNEENFNKSAENAIEFSIVNGKDINPENDDKLLLLKKTSNANRFVVYDSGFFEEETSKNYYTAII